MSIYADFIPTVSNNTPGSKKNRTGLIVGIVVGVGVGVAGLLFVTGFCIFKRRRDRMKNDQGKL